MKPDEKMLLGLLVVFFVIVLLALLLAMKQSACLDVRAAGYGETCWLPFGG